MITHKPISFKINEDLLPQLDTLCAEYGVKRNAMLNILVSIGVSNLKGNRSMFELIRVYSGIEF